MTKTKQHVPYTIILFIALVFVSLTGCNSGNSDEVTFVVVPAGADTPNRVVTQLPPTVVIATSVPSTATPDIDPDIILQVANRDLRDGYYESAFDFYKSILERPDALPETQAEAAFGLGKSALLAGFFQEAVNAFDILTTQHPTHHRAAQAYFLRGDAYLGLSQWQTAINDFQQYLVLRPGLIDSYVHERIGDAQLASDQYAASLNSYTLAANAGRYLTSELALREKVARLHTLNGDVYLAVEQYDAILAVAENPGYRAEVEFLSAQALIDAGHLGDGLARMQRVFDLYEDQPYAYQAMGILLEHNPTLNSYTRGRVNYFAGDYAAAIEAFNTFTSNTPLTAIPAQLHLYLGRSYRAVGNSQAAQVAFNTLIEQYPTDALFGEALLETGRTYFLADDHTAAIARYLEVAETYSYLDETAAQALWRVGYLYGVNGNQAESRATFMQLADLYPNTVDAKDGLFIAASAAVNAGDTLGAETIYERLLTLTTGTEQASVYLQIANLALQRGDTAKANSSFGLSIALSPDTYSSARAQDIMNGRAPFTSPTSLQFEFDDLAEISAAEDWLRTTYGITQASPLWPLSPTLEADPRIMRGRELWDVGVFKEAEDEFLDIGNSYEKDGLASYQLAIFFRVLGAYQPSIISASYILRAVNVGTLEAPLYIARMRFPAYYRDEVLRISEEYDIDPLLLFSLIRHESFFDTHATAAAGEKGLTQVIPNTGDYIAEQLAWPDYQHRDLFRPHAGIEFGAYYLSEQLNRFDGNVYAALAGYNAGPGRAIDWLALAGDDPDLFMTMITIDSVQSYIQRIYSNYNVYRALYGVGP